jgi:hypothetical protein
MCGSDMHLRVLFSICLPTSYLTTAKDSGLAHSAAHITLVCYSNSAPTTDTPLGSSTNTRLGIAASDGKGMAHLKT